MQLAGRGGVTGAVDRSWHCQRPDPCRGPAHCHLWRPVCIPVWCASCWHPRSPQNATRAVAPSAAPRLRQPLAPLFLSSYGVIVLPLELSASKPRPHVSPTVPPARAFAAGSSPYNIIGPAGALSGMLATYVDKWGPEIIPWIAMLSGVFSMLVLVCGAEARKPCPPPQPPAAARRAPRPRAPASDV